MRNPSYWCVVVSQAPANESHVDHLLVFGPFEEENLDDLMYDVHNGAAEGEYDISFVAVAPMYDFLEDTLVVPIIQKGIREMLKQHKSGKV